VGRLGYAGVWRGWRIECACRRGRSWGVVVFWGWGGGGAFDSRLQITDYIADSRLQTEGGCGILAWRGAAW
jgi:hypothetical protein